MKKILTATLAAIAVLAFASSPAFACGAGCPQGAKSASAKVGQTDAKLASADGQTCPYATAKVCAAKLGISEEECRALCESGKLTVVNMSVKGMTCGNCENSVTASLEKVPGVVAVASVDYKTGTASVFFDTRKGKTDAVVTAVTNTGFQAEVIPAVAKAPMTTGAKKMGAGGGPACCAKGKKTASAKKTGDPQ